LGNYGFYRRAEVFAKAVNHYLDSTHAQAKLPGSLGLGERLGFAE
jgi:hypothetical protein